MHEGLMVFWYNGMLKKFEASTKPHIYEASIIPKRATQNRPPFRSRNCDTDNANARPLNQPFLLLIL